MGRLTCAVTVFACCWLGQASGATIDEAMQEEARDLLARVGHKSKLDENRFIALALELAGVCPATIAADFEDKARKDRKQTIDALIARVGRASC